MKKKFWAGLAIGLFMVGIGMVGVANATIIDINARDRHGTDIYFEAG